MTTENKGEFIDRMMHGWEGACECCGRYAKVYRRTLHSSVALQLIQLYKLGGFDMYVHASKVILSRQTGTGDFTKAKMWKLIEPMEHVEGKTRSSGMWRLTTLGKEFVEGKAAIQKYALVFDDAVIGYRGGVVYVHDCLGTAFNYTEMMRA